MGAIDRMMTYSVDSGHDFDGGVEFTVVVPRGEVLEPLLEESGLHVLQEVDPLEVGNGSGGDIFGRSAIRTRATGDVSDTGTARSGIGKGGGYEENDGSDGRGMHYEKSRKSRCKKSR